MKKLNISKRLIALFMTLSVVALFTSCSCSLCGISLCSAEPAIDEVLGYDIDVVGQDSIVKLFKNAEDGTCAFFTETQTGKTISKAYAVLSDGTKKLIKNIDSFLIENNYKSFSIEVEDAISVEQFSISPTTFSGYYLGQNYSFDIKTHFYPENCTNKRVKFYTSNSAVATVNNSGVVTIKGDGTATITALTLDGALKATCMLSIKNGEVKLKDSIGYAEFTSAALVGNRYDEESDMKSSFDCVAYSPKSDSVIVGGTSIYDNGSQFGIIVYGMPEAEGDSFKGRYQIDPENKYSNDYIQDIVYCTNTDQYYVLSHISKVGLNNEQMMVSFFSEKYDSTLNQYVLSKSNEIILDTTSDYKKILVANDDLYCLGITDKGYATVDKYDKDFKLKSKTTFPGILSIVEAMFNESNGELVMVGGSKNNASSLILIDTLNDGKVYMGYSSELSNASLCDVAIIDNTHFAVAGNGTINGQNVGLVEMFVFDTAANLLMSVNVIKFENVGFGETKLTGIEFAHGVLCVTGFEQEIQEESYFICSKKASLCDDNTSCSGICQKTVSEDYICGTVVTLSPDMKFISALKYFNSQYGTGKHQYFNKSLMLPNGNLICVGKSNYRLLGTDYNGYIQFNVGTVDN